MSDINVLIAQRNEILDKIKGIEENCEGIDNENNAKKISELNMQKSYLLAKKNELASKLAMMEQQTNTISAEINNLSGTGIDRILDAIKEQRWYFFKNKPKVLMDKLTGILWANLDYYNCAKDESGKAHSFNEDCSEVHNLNLDGYSGWEIPTYQQMYFLSVNKTFPFKRGKNYEILNKVYWRVQNIDSNNNYITFDLSICRKSRDNPDSYWLPCSSSITTEDYKNNISKENKVYTERERLQFTLNLFVDNGLEPIFDDEEITELYRKMYIEKPALMNKLNELQEQINNLQKEVLLSSEFDYKILLSKYDVDAIDSSIIKYYEGVKTWIDEIMDKMKYYESQKEEIITDCNAIGLILSKKYEENPNLTEEENEMLKDRQKFFKKHFEIGMSSVNTKLLSIKKQAEDIENRIEEINCGDNAIKELAMLENEERASFSFIAENTANIIKNALMKIEYFEKNREFAVLAVKVWDEWTEDYKVFKTAKKEELKNLCEEDGIEQDIWEKWYSDWNKTRFTIEKQLLPLIQRGLKGEIVLNKVSVSNDVTQENIINELLELIKEYKEKVDDFYIDERKGIYQKFAFQVGGDLQEKFESESELYKITSAFQEKMQKIIFSIDKVEDRLYLLEWANKISYIQIDEVLAFIKDKELVKIGEDIIKQFMELKRRNYDVYISDAKAYSEELSRREKEYNSLMFKMRKDLMKN